jgi:hypothetical protein
MIHVTSREVVRSAREEFAGEFNGLMTRMSSLARKLVGRSNGATQTTQPQPRLPEPDYGGSYYDGDNGGGGFKWQYLGIGLLIAGGVGAGLLLGQDGGNGGTVTPPPPPPPPPPVTQLPGPPGFN